MKGPVAGAEYGALRARARALIMARDFIPEILSSAWLEAHSAARAACLEADELMERLTAEDRAGNWEGPAEREMRLRGLL